jgi:hypothetical protein
MNIWIRKIIRLIEIKVLGRRMTTEEAFQEVKKAREKFLLSEEKKEGISTGRRKMYVGRRHSAIVRRLPRKVLRAA